MRVRALNERGIENVTAFLASPDAAAGGEVPPEMIQDDFLAPPLEVALEVEPREFASRFDLAHYLSGVLPKNGAVLDYNRGLWTWLALYYFRQLCPMHADGRRNVGEIYRYVLSTDYRHYYRHLVAMPYVIYRLHGKFSRAILYPPVNMHGDFAEQLASRQEIITNRGLIEAVDRLYFAPDDGLGAPKRGATNRKKGGTLRRLVDVIQQLDLTYDLYGMTAQDILGILPREFARWIGSSTGHTA